MRITSLVLRNFRNYIDLSVEFPHNINIFIGKNAQGKTNLLEALYFGAMGRSHRTAVDYELIRWHQSAAMVEIAFIRQDVPQRLQFRLHATMPKEIILNGNVVKTREIIGRLNYVLFSPEDLWLIKGTPAVRRRFLDIEISQANPTYYYQLLQYNRILAQRNQLLKKIRDGEAAVDLLDSWDEQLAVVAAAIVAKRRQAVQKLAMLANLMHRRITANQENLAISYQLTAPETALPDAGSQQWYKNLLRHQRRDDIRRGSTGIGPHRDDLVLAVNGSNLRVYGSQGQQRTGVLALKLAELEFIKSEQKEYPVLLLDDVLSELDSQRQFHLLAFIKDRVQTFITTTDEREFPDKQIAKIYRVANGKITG